MEWRLWKESTFDCCCRRSRACTLRIYTLQFGTLRWSLECSYKRTMPCFVYISLNTDFRFLLFLRRLTLAESRESQRHFRRLARRLRLLQALFKHVLHVSRCSTSYRLAAFTGHISTSYVLPDVSYYARVFLLFDSLSDLDSCWILRWVVQVHLASGGVNMYCWPHFLVFPPLAIRLLCFNYLVNSIVCTHGVTFIFVPTLIHALFHIILNRAGRINLGWLFLFGVLMAAGLLFCMVFFVSLCLCSPYLGFTADNC